MCNLAKVHKRGVPATSKACSENRICLGGSAEGFAVKFHLHASTSGDALEMGTQIQCVFYLDSPTSVVFRILK